MRTLGYALLGLLAQEPLSGYDLSKHLSRPLGFFWPARHSQIYPELAELEAAGLVTHLVVEQSDRPDKKVYAITEPGLEAMRAWVTSPLEVPTVRDELVLRAYSLWLADPDKARATFSEHAARHAEQLAHYEEWEGWIREHAPEALWDVRTPGFAKYATLRRGIAYERDCLEWCNWIVACLDAPIPDGARGASTPELDCP